MIYGVDIGARRIAIAGPDLELAALTLPDPPTGTSKWSSPREVHLIGGFVEAVVPPGAALWLERPFMGRPNTNINTAIRLGMTAGAVFARHAGDGHIIDQSTWKAALLGHGNASKDQISAWLWANHPAYAEACFGDQDLFDASAIRCFGVAVAEGRVEKPWELPGRRPRPAVRTRIRAAHVEAPAP